MRPSCPLPVHLPPAPGPRDALPCPGPGGAPVTPPSPLSPYWRRTMAHAIEHRSTTPDELTAARARLARAFPIRDHARGLYESEIGTSSEHGAYMRLRQA